MTFHTDAALPDVLRQLYEMFTGFKPINLIGYKYLIQSVLL